MTSRLFFFGYSFNCQGVDLATFEFICKELHDHFVLLYFSETRKLLSHYANIEVVLRASGVKYSDLTVWISGADSLFNFISRHKILISRYWPEKKAFPFDIMCYKR